MNMVRVERVNIAEQTEREAANARAAKTAAVQDYNIMMGNLEDPDEEEEDE